MLAAEHNRTPPSGSMLGVVNGGTHIRVLPGA
jgi:hypothetical protein